MAIKKEIKNCLVPQCQRTARSRGLCDIHYTGLAYKVRTGQFTWAQLEESGVCVPKVKGRGDGGIGMSKFLKSKGLM